MKFLKGLKKAWMTLPIKAKKVYKLSAIVIFVGGYYIYSLFVSSNAPMESSVTIAKNPPSMDSKDEDSQLIDYQQAQFLKQREAELAEETRESGQSYIPDFKALESETANGTDFSVKKNEDKPKEPPPPEEAGARNFPRDDRTDRRAGEEERALREEERRQQVEARVAAYANIVAIVQAPKVAGTINFHDKRVAQPNSNQVLTENKNGVNGVSNPIVVANRLTVGDTLMAKIDNYINTDNSSKFVRLTLLEGELESGIVMGEFERVNGVITIVTKTLSKNGVTTPFPGVVVTADGRMETGITTDTDYHTIYRWSALVFSGALKGAGEMYLTASDEVITENGTVIKVNEKDPLDIVMGVAKGVGDVTADIAKKEFDIPPTVIVDPIDMPVVGIMLTGDAEAPWFSPAIRELAR